MKICSNCQNQNVNDAVYCRYCGHNLTESADNLSEQGQPKTDAPVTLIAENDTPMNKNVLKFLFRRTKFLGWLCLGLGLFLLILAVVGIVLEAGDQKYLLFISIIDIVCGVVLIYLENVSVKKNKVVTDDMHVLYKFYQDSFCVLTFDGNVKKEESNLTYKNVSKVRKVDNYIYLYLGTNALVVNLNNFTVGTKEDFVIHLRKNCENVKIKKI